MRQYEIRWATLPDPVGRRPVLLLTRSAAYEYLNHVIVAEVTRTMRGIPQEVEMGRKEGLRVASVVNFDNVHVVEKTRLGTLIGALQPRRHREIKRALGHALDWAELKVL